MATSYNGWPASRDPSAIGINRTWEPIKGHRFHGGIKSGDVETVMTYLVRQLDARVEPIEHYQDGDEWGWYYKPSANSPNTLSCHSSGTAIDYNATKHPNGKRGTFTAAQVREIRAILAECGVIRWLGDATRVPDEMHFEIKGTPAQVAAAARKIREMSKPPTPTPTPEPPKPNPDPEEEEMATWYIYLKDNRKDGENYVRISDSGEVPLVKGVHLYAVNGVVASYQDDQTLAVAKFLAGLAGKKVTVVGSKTKPHGIIKRDESGKVVGTEPWFFGFTVLDGPLYDIKK